MLKPLPARQVALALALAAPVFSFDLSAQAQTNIALDNLTVTTEKSKLTIKHVDFIGANITAEEATKLLTNATREEAAAILGKLEAKQIVIPEATVGPADGSGSVVLRDLQANDISKGVVARVSLASFAGDGKDKSGGRVTLKGGAVTMDKLDAAQLIAALKSGTPLEGPLKASRFVSNGVEITGPDKDTPADAPGGNLVRVKMASMNAEQTYEADIPARTAISVNGLTVELPKASKAGATLAAEGFERIETNWRFAGAYDSAQRSYSLDEFSVDAPAIASLRLGGKLADVDKAIMTGNAEARIGAAAASAVGALELRLVNAGAFEKIVAHVAKDQNKAPPQILAEWKAAATMLLPALTGGAPVGAAAGAAVAKFVDNPKSLTISIKSKGGPIKIAEALGGGDPMALLQKVDVAFFTDGAPVTAPSAAPSAPAARPAPPAVAQAPAAPKKLTGLEAWSAIVGNTVSGKDSDGEELQEFYKPDGTLRQLNDGTVTSGKWALKGQKVCIEYSNGDEETCYQIEVFGDAATFTDDDGDGQRYKILQGNPKGL